MNKFQGIHGDKSLEYDIITIFTPPAVTWWLVDRHPDLRDLWLFLESGHLWPDRHLGHLRPAS